MDHLNCGAEKKFSAEIGARRSTSDEQVGFIVLWH